VTYLIWYLAIGVVVLLVVFISHRVSVKPEQDFTREIMEALHPERKVWHYRFLDKAIIPLLAAMLVLVAWPAAIYMKGKEMLATKKAEPELESDKKEFSVTDANLLRKISLEEIERLERIDDPLGAVPDAPFGHLNGAWMRFKSSLEPQDSIWLFSAHWTADWGRRELREGYVIVRANGMGPHLLTTWRILEDE
jgi:hypothetical protein